MNEYTPGPWTTVKEDHVGEIAIVAGVAGGQESPIARVPLHKEADAILIAAAPEMLELLEDMNGDDESGMYHKFCQKGEALIAKAGGQE